MHLEAPHASLCQAAVAEAIRKAMKRHRTDADIAQYGLQALDRLSHGADEGAQEVGLEFVAAVGLIGVQASQIGFGSNLSCLHTVIFQIR